MFDFISNVIAQATWLQLAAPITVFSSVSVLFVCFVWKYTLKARQVRLRLQALAQAVHEVGNVAPSQRRAKVQQIFEGHKLQNLWKEYADTLHDQHEVVDGEQRVLRSRATASAAHFFHSQVVVESPINAEFFKHLPGILTGIGIVGTFFGLMLGLMGFDASTPDKVTGSVEGLLKDVMFAFSGSFYSIFVSMLVTGIEKYQINRCYEQLEALNETIDELFESGVGEEYLAELVRSSQESSVQTRQLKDSLVTDLREMLQNLVDTQVRESLKLADTLSSTYRESGQQLAEQVSGAIVNSLETPLKAIAGAVQQASGDQSSQVQNLLQDVLVAFMNKLETTFGQQFQGLNEVLGQSVTSMQSMQHGFQELLAKMEQTGQANAEQSSKAMAQLMANMQVGQNAMQASMNEMLGNLQEAVVQMTQAGQGGAQRMSEQMEAMFTQSQSRQEAMAQNLQVFVEAMKDTVGQGQQAILDKLAAAMERLSEELDKIFQQTAALQEQAAHSAQERSAALQAEAQQMVGGLGGQVQTLLQSVSQQQGAMQESVAQLASQTQKQLLDLQQGAEALRARSEQEAAERSQALQSESQQAVHGLQQQVQTLLEAVRSQDNAVQATIEKMGAQVRASLEQMQQGADKMRGAAERFDSAGESVARANTATAQVLGSLQNTGTALVTAGQELSSVVADYRGNREAIGQTLSALQNVMTRAQEEAAARSQYLADMRAQAERLQGINAETRGYLDQVSDVLGNGFNEFSAGMERSLRQTMGSLDAELSKAVTQLAGGVEGVKESLEDLSETLDQVRRR